MMDQKEAAQSRPEKSEELVAEWWKRIANDRGARAELRRAKTLMEVTLIPAFHDLYRRLGATRWRDPTRIALVAGILARVEIDNRASRFAEQLATTDERRTKAPMSGLRFRRLLQHDDADALFSAMGRAVRLVDKKANVRDLATSLYYWNDRTRRDWAFAYYAKAPSES